VSANPARGASRIGHQVVSQIAGVALAVFIVQHSAARGRRSPHAE
jgi:hypothetical protein